MLYMLFKNDHNHLKCLALRTNCVHYPCFTLIIKYVVVARVHRCFKARGYFKAKSSRCSGVVASIFGNSRNTRRPNRYKLVWEGDDIIEIEAVCLGTNELPPNRNISRN